MTDLLAHLQAAVGPRAVDGVHFAPRIEPKKLANAAKWAPFGQETPLLLIDDSVFGGGKAGALITSHALYCDEPRVRLELGWLQYAPSWPEGADGAPRVWTPHGEATLKRMTLDEVQAAWGRVLSTIVQVNTGQVVGVASSAPVEGPIGELVMKHLVRDDVAIAPAIPRKKLHNASVAFADWIDYVNGERLVAFLDETALGAGDEGIALTDRRVIGRVNERHLVAPYGALTAVDATKGFLENKLAVSAGPFSGQLPLNTLKDATEPLVLFLRDVMRLPPEQRWAPTPPLAHEGDPTGAATLAARLVVPDARVPILLRYVHDAVARGIMAVPTGQDLVDRIHILHQTIAFGRGCAQGWRISPLHGADLEYLLQGVFGEPIGVSGDATTRVLDFAAERRGPSIGAAASTAVGLTLLAVVGVGWVSAPKQRLQGVRITLRDLGRGTGFGAQGVLNGALHPLQQLDPATLGFVHAALDDLEALTLFERAVFGWQAPTAALFAIDPQVLAQHAQAVLGPVDLGAFSRR